jgi:flagellar basal-body rod protein FlgB
MDPLSNVLGRALDGLARRQEAISGNLANVDTPGYRPRSVDFESSLRAQLASRSGSDLAARQPAAGPSANRAMLRTDPRHLGPSGADLGDVESSNFDATLRADRNTVDVEEEMSALIETQLRYSAITRLLNMRMSSVREVLRR